MVNNFTERVIYKETSATSAMRNIPRFGRTSDFAQIIAGKEEAEAYIIGLLFAGIMVFSIFFAWTVILMTFKCLGQKRMGYLAGSPLVKGTRSASVCRIVYIAAAICFVAFSITFVTEGLTNLKQSFTTILEAVRNANTVANELDAVIKDVQRIGNNAIVLRDTLLFALASGGQACLEQLEWFDFTSDQDTTQAFKDGLDNAGAFEPPESDQFMDATEYVMATTNEIEDSTDNIETGDWQSLVIIIPYAITPLVLVIGVILSHLRIQHPMMQYLITWAIHPLFILQVIFACIVCSVILIAASANADFCSGGEDNIPDRTVKNMLINFGWDEEDLVYAIMAFYIGQCSSETPFGFLDEYREDIGSITAHVLDFSAGVKAAAGALSRSRSCTSDVTYLEALNTVMLNNLAQLLDSVQDIGDILNCNNIVKIYTLPVYVGTCTYSIAGITWAWASFAVVGFMGLTMIMLRSSWKVDLDEDAYAQGKSVSNPEQIVSDYASQERESVDEEYEPYATEQQDGQCI